MFKNVGIKLLVIAGVVLGGLYAALPLQSKIDLGLDLKGGMHLIYKVDTEKLSAEDRQGAGERAVEIIRNRIDELGVKEPVIQPQGQDKILIQLPGVVDRSRALAIIGRTALLEFKVVEFDSEVIKANTPDADADHVWAQTATDKLLLQKEAVMTGSALKTARIGFDAYGAPNVSIEFNPDGTKQFAKVTKENVGRRLAVVLDGKVKTAPAIREPILSGEAQITGTFTPEDAKDISLVLRSGALPCPLYIEEERTVGPLLGQDSINRGVKATIAGGIAVSVFMIVYYLFAGIVSVVALAINLILILAGLALMGATLTLPGIAGIILTLGMAVDANVLIYERIREEIALKRPINMALRIGYQKAFRTILDSNLTTLIAALCLYIFGTGPIKGFGITLMLGIVASMFTSLFVSRTLFQFLIGMGIVKKLPMLKVIGNVSVNFIKKVRVALIVSAVVIIAGVAFFLRSGESVYGVDFSGGQVQEYQFKSEIDLSALRQQLADKGLNDFSLYEYSSQQNAVAIKSAEDTFDAVKEVLETNYAGQYDILRVDKVGPVVGKILRKKALFAIIFAIFGILLYVTVRFHHFDFGVAAVAALFHDVLLAPGLLLLISLVCPGFVYKIDLMIVTALLTIAGYSINDTIVVYDRIRELRAKLHKAKLSEVINAAINQTLARTIITSFTTLLVVALLFIFGSENLRGFSATLLVGILAGTYSSVFIASPLVIMLRKK